MSIFSFHHTDSDTGQTIYVETEAESHFEVTDAYLQFLRGCGFIIKYGDNNDVNSLNEDDPSN